MRLRRPLPAALATVAALAALASPAAAQVPRGDFPAGYPLPGSTVFPEGVAVQKDRYYVSSTSDGTIFQGRLGRRGTRVFQPPGAQGRTTAIGLEPWRKRLLVAGGPTGLVFIYSTRTGKYIRRYTSGPTPDRATFINDVAATPNGDAYVTDSLRPVIYRIAANDIRHDTPDTDPLPIFLDLTGTGFQYQQGFNANGIVVSGDDRYLLVVQSNTGKLFRITVADRSVTEVALGGETLANGDGMLLAGRRLYVARNRDGIVVRVNLARDYGSGRVVARSRTPLLFPTTLAPTGRRLLVVNGQLDRRPMPGQPPPRAPELPFTVSSIRRP